MPRDPQPARTTPVKPVRRSATPTARHGARPAAAPGSRSRRRSVKQQERQQPAYVPTRREIARRCREIQATWTPATRRLRCLYRTDPMVLTPVHIELEPERHLRTA